MIVKKAFEQQAVEDLEETEKPVTSTGPVSRAAKKRSAAAPASGSATPGKRQRARASAPQE